MQPVEQTVSLLTVDHMLECPYNHKTYESIYATKHRRSARFNSILLFFDRNFSITVSDIVQGYKDHIVTMKMIIIAIHLIQTKFNRKINSSSIRYSKLNDDRNTIRH